MFSVIIIILFAATSIQSSTTTKGRDLQLYASYETRVPHCHSSLSLLFDHDRKRERH